MDSMLLSSSSGQGYSYGTDGTGDANAALAELDQGLRCGRLGEQSEAIVRFPTLFAKYPFPILINSALLKLADIFKQCSNFTKLCVLRVVQQSERHLDKITNVDEFVKRISSVLHSNDPVARALTLRLLGSVAVLVPERKQVHHAVRNALKESSSPQEVEAAIFAAGKFAAESESFSANVCHKIAEMIGSHSTPLDMKIKLISVFQSMKRLDSATGALVRETLCNLLPVYPSQEFAIVTLHTLTLLSSHCLVDVPSQVELLLNHLTTDPRKSVKRQVLIDLRILAGPDYAHLWSEDNVESAVNFASNCSQAGVLCGSLDILSDLVRHTESVDKFRLEEGGADAPVLRLCGASAYSKKMQVVARGTLLLTLLASTCVKDMRQVEGVDIVSDACMSIEALFLLVNTADQSGVRVLRDCLKSLVMLCRVRADACDQFVDIVGGLLHSTSGLETKMLLCQVLAALGDMKEGVLNLLLPDICHLLTTSGGEEGEEGHTVALCTLLFQSVKGHRWTPECASAVRAACDSLDMWSAYKVARAASRYGHHACAHEIYLKISQGVSSEHLYYWLTGLAQISHGEKTLAGDGDNNTKDLIERLSQGNAGILEGHTTIKASAGTASRSHEFRLNYLRCRSELLRTLCQTVTSCNSIHTSPPPYIASTIAKQTHDDLWKCGRVTQLLRQSVKDYAAVAAMYGSLYETSFDADDATLAHIQVWQHVCNCISRWIEMVCLKSSRQGTIFDDLDVAFAPSLPKDVSEYGIDIKGLVAKGEEIAEAFKSLTGPEAPAPISRSHTACLIKVVELLASEQLCLPRLFFQSLQTTSIKLAVTPQPSNAGEPIAVPSSQHMAIKVEGVITTAGSADFRKIDSIRLSLSSVLQSPINPTKPPDGTADGKVRTSECNQSQTVVPHNDFFTAQFLVPFPTPGNYLVGVDTRLVDKAEQAWKQSGLHTVLNIKAFEDGAARMQASNASGRRQ